MTKLSSIKGASSAMILSFMLVCSACGKKESAQSTLSSVNPDQALAELGFAMSGEGLISWGGKSGDNGTYIYKDVILDLVESGAVMSVETLTLAGVTMVEAETGEQEASFASLKAEGLSLTGNDDVMLTIENYILSDPTPETARGFVNILSQTDLADLAENAVHGFGELEFNKVAIVGYEDGTEINFTIDNVTVRDANKDKIGRFALSDVAMSFSEGASINGHQDVSLSLAALDFTDLPVSQFTKAGDGYSGVASQLNAMNPYEDFAGDVTVTDLNFDIMGVMGEMSSLTRRAQVNGDVTEVTQKMENFILTPGDQVGPMQMLSALGYEQFEINSEGVTYLDEGKDLITLGENYLSLKDGFNLSLDAKLGDYGAAFETYAKNIALLENDEQSDPVARRALMAGFLEELVDALTIYEFGMTLDDQGLAERGLNFAALIQGTEPERVKSQLSGMMLMYTMILEDDAKSQMMGQIVEAAADFLNDPGALKLGFYPASPISGASLRGVFTDDPSADEISADDLGFVAEGG